MFFPGRLRPRRDYVAFQRGRVENEDMRGVAVGAFRRSRQQKDVVICNFRCPFGSPWYDGAC